MFQSIKKNPKLQRLLSKLTKAPEGNKFAIAVSGGTDSVAMLLLMREWCRMKRKSICVFHVDHSMRQTSSADAEWVKKLCAERDIDFYSRKATEEDSTILLRRHRFPAGYVMVRLPTRRIPVGSISVRSTTIARG